MPPPSLPMANSAPTSGPSTTTRRGSVMDSGYQLSPPVGGVVALEHEVAAVHARRTEREVGLAEEQLVGAGIHADQVVAQDAGRIQPRIVSGAIVEQHRVEVGVVARGGIHRGHAEEAEAVGARR